MDAVVQLVGTCGHSSTSSGCVVHRHHSVAEPISGVERDHSGVGGAERGHIPPAPLSGCGAVCVRVLTGRRVQ
eukprot:gene12286-biopygen256